jgi:hypothetical protein
VTRSDEDRYRTALEEIVRVATTPDTNVIGTQPGGGVGPIWSVSGQDKAYAKMVQIARAALAGN